MLWSLSVENSFDKLVLDIFKTLLVGVGYAILPGISIISKWNKHIFWEEILVTSNISNLDFSIHADMINAISKYGLIEKS